MTEKRIRIGIDTEGFISWAGGIDFVLMIAEALDNNPYNDVLFIVPRNSFIDNLLKRIKCFILAKGNKKKYNTLKESELINCNNLIKNLKNRSIDLPIVYYNVNISRLFSDIELKKRRCYKNNKIDILIPSFYCRKNDGSIKQIGYVYDFQHKYLNDFFTDEEKKRRDNHFKNQIINSKVVLVNSNDTKKDIIKYYGDIVKKVEVIPFLPFIDNIKKYNCDLSKYNLPNMYYVISNQFWVHKAHGTAFEALEILYSQGITNIHIVCTGAMYDYRNKEYIDKIMNTISDYECRDNIHFLGYIPKDDQLTIIKKSIGLIQPTLFEGGPGGGAVYNALCLGIPCLVSDIPVNKEIKGYENVYFFETQNPFELANLMKNKYTKEEDEDALIYKSKHNKVQMGEYLTELIKYEIMGG